jgi:hypothetical protein
VALFYRLLLCVQCLSSLPPLLAPVLQKDDAAKSGVEGVRPGEVTRDERECGSGRAGGDVTHGGDDACGAGEAASRLVERERRDQR